MLQKGKNYLSGNITADIISFYQFEKLLLLFTSRYNHTQNYLKHKNTLNMKIVKNMLNPRNIFLVEIYAFPSCIKMQLSYWTSQSCSAYLAKAWCILCLSV